MKSEPDPHYRHRFPAEIISHAVWLYHSFSLSFRDVELLLAERGITLSYETVRRWCAKFGASFAKRILRRRPRPGDKWHLDEGVPRTHDQQWECGAAWKMRVGPSKPTVRGRLQTTASCDGKEPWW
jgi:putative transposase